MRRFVYLKNTADGSAHIAVLQAFTSGLLPAELLKDLISG